MSDPVKPPSNPRGVCRAYTPLKLFLQRLVEDWKFQYGVLTSVVDWTVLLYMVVPAVVVAVREYVLLWMRLPDWLALVPHGAVFGLAFLFAWTGSPRLFIEQADELFLKQRTEWYGTIIRLSLVYSFIKTLLLSALFVAALAPVLLHHYTFGLLQLLLLLVLTTAAKVDLGLARQLVPLRFHGFGHWLAQAAVLATAGLTFGFVAPLAVEPGWWFAFLLAVLAAAGVALVHRRLSVENTFLEDCRQAMEHRLRYVGLILSLAGQNAKRPRTRRKQPFLFRNSQPVFRRRNVHNCLVEFGVKSFLRNRGSVMLYLQVTALGVLLLETLPAQWQLLALPALAFVLASLIRLHWVEETHSAFFRLLPWNKGDEIVGASKFIFLVALPGIMVFSSITGFILLSWPGVLAALPVSAVCLYYAAQKLVIYMGI